MTHPRGFMHVSQQASLDSAAERAMLSGAPQLPMYRAAADRRIGIVNLFSPDINWPGGFIKRCPRPLIVVICDDCLPGDSRSPAAWRAARKLREWVRWVMVHGAGGEAAHYRAAVQAAEIMGRVAVIETGSERVAQWAEFLRCPMTMKIVPRDGLPHPIHPPRGAMQ